MAAADGARKELAEWPPHPDRVFMALAAAHFETDEDASARAALEWLEALPPPELAASEATTRTTVTSYVPVNDTKVGKNPAVSDDLGKLKNAGLGVVPEFRSRQARGFPVVIPRDPTVHVTWPGEVPAEHRVVLESLCRKVTHVGHSASLVQMWVEDSPPASTWQPEPTFAERRLRISGPGRLVELERRMNRTACLEYADRNEQIMAANSKQKKQLKAEQAERFPGGPPVSRRPEPGLWQGYARPRPAPTSEVPATVFDQRIVVLTLAGLRPGLRATLKLTAALRGALLSGCRPPIPEWVSGHEPNGSPTRKPHLALFPLPFVGAEHADGRILGLGLALPAGIPPEEVSRVLALWLNDDDGLPRPIRLFDGEWLECEALLEERETPPWNLRSEAWTRPARCWSTVTPVVLDRHHDGKGRWDQGVKTVMDACERIGLPRPLDVALHPVSRSSGVPAASEFEPVSRKSGGRLKHCHAVLLFPEPVRGPVLIGAGRFRGYGLCRPDDPKGELDA
jgi:CRISPR-associated protein Csb2